jgi:hydrogenase maturation protease
MNVGLVEQIAGAVLYEGYILYPYRPSVKNRQRWTFGGLLPDCWCQEHPGSDSASIQTECLVEGSLDTTLEVQVRFLRLINRTVGECTPPLADWPLDTEPAFRKVDSLQVNSKRYQAWQEARQRVIDVRQARVQDWSGRAHEHPFRFGVERDLEPLRQDSGEVVGVLVRELWPLAGVIECRVRPVEEGLYKLTVRVRNQTNMHHVNHASRDSAVMQSLASTHVVLGVRDGQFVSLIDPPERYRPYAVTCQNVGNWPVLVGQEGNRDTMLASPIILYDYPQIAPESPGDLFDGTEIDEILTLRILTLTQEEKEQAAAVDERARDLLQRTEALAREQLLGLHGTIRGLRPLPEGG